MTSRKRNEWLDAGESDDQDAGYDSEAVETSKGGALGRRAIKRRKVESDEEGESGGESEIEEEDEEEQTDDVQTRTARDDRFDTAGFDDDEEDGAPHNDDDEEEDIDDDFEDDPTDPTSKKNTKLKPLTPAQLAKAQKAAKRTGVIYISRIPPFMKPTTLRRLLSPHGAINRLFLTPESPTSHKSRIRSGGNRKRTFTDGWVEFARKSDAKLVAEMGYYYDDVWNIKYLKGFKWHHLTEQIKNENAERAARLRAEIARTGRENKLFLQDVERAKMVEGMEAKRKGSQRGKGEGGLDGTVGGGAAVEDAPRKQEVRRHFRQNEVKVKKPKAKAEQSEEVKRVLSKIF
ncbi:RNA-binding ATPase activator esf2 [Coniosporium tulheliwenetii]|uniref:RNA-binding ATPase activator esf2 n=1 Tax=Coniosporium tulheliwenetii TaxID=3383036 RepID=A0ACC2ZAR8_9PEZI|nr:RNA-binding ATPase activator esf2 [Cladosporium sp. JES 115]